MKLQYILLLSVLCTLVLTRAPIKTAIDAGENISGNIQTKVDEKLISLNNALPVALPPVPKLPVVKPPVAKPVAAKPVAAKPVAAKPVVKPVAAKPVAAKPVVKPAAAKPVAAKPAAAKPAAVKPVAAKPAAAKPASKVVLPSCGLGQHNYNAKCVSNNGNSCKKFDKNTGSCAECKWYAWEVKNDSAHQNAKTVGSGNWCETRWWLWTIIFVSTLLLLCMLAGVITYCCCGGKKEKPVVEEKAPLVRAKEVEVCHVAPTYHRTEVVQARPHQVHHNTVYTSPQHQTETRYVSQGHTQAHGHTQSYVSTNKHASDVRVHSPQRVGHDSRVIVNQDADYHRNTNSHKYYN